MIEADGLGRLTLKDTVLCVASDCHNACHRGEIVVIASRTKIRIESRVFRALPKGPQTRRKAVIGVLLAESLLATFRLMEIVPVGDITRIRSPYYFGRGKQRKRDRRRGQLSHD